MDLFEIIKNLSPLSIVALVIMVVGGAGVLLLMTNLIPGFGVASDETMQKPEVDQGKEGRDANG